MYVVYILGLGINKMGWMLENVGIWAFDNLINNLNLGFWPFNLGIEYTLPYLPLVRGNSSTKFSTHS